MERYAKYVGFAAGGAALVFFLVAVVSGVPFLSAFLRATVSGVLFGGGIFGLVYLADLFLPGLVSNGPTIEDDVMESEPEEQPGSRLNIVVDDDTGLEDAPESTPEDAIDEVPAQEVSEDPAEPAETADEDGTDSETDEESLVEEVQEQTAENAEEIMRAAIVEEQDGAELVGDRSEVDDMPDIGAFTGSFVSSEYSENEGEGSDFISSGGDSNAIDAGNDPAQIARAIQTLLNKDEQT